MAVDNLDKVRRLTIDDPPDAVDGTRADFWMVPTSRGVILPPWGSRERERWLRAFSRHEYNWLGQISFNAMIAKVAATPWEISGKRGVAHFQDVLREAQFGAGWTDFISMSLWDFFTHDIGMFWEVIGPGNPMRPMTAAAVGLRVLDPLRCVPTGDPEFPVRYYSQHDSEIHLLHYTRVRQLVSMPNSDSLHPGTGLSALSRAIAIVQRQISMNRFIESRLDDKPAPGIIAVNGMPRQQWEQAVHEYRKQQTADETPEWGRQMFVYSNGPDQKVEIVQTVFSQAPEGWKFTEYMNVDVNGWAGVMGMDVQEIWQLSGGNIGSSGQSEILHEKSQARGYGLVLTMLERAINMILPDNLEFEFKRHDPHANQQAAQIAKTWAEFVGSIGAAATDEEKRIILANQVEAFKDAVSDADGSITRLNDLQDAAPVVEAVEPTLDDQNPQQTAGTDPNAQVVDDQKARAKAIQATRIDFEDGLEDLIADARAKEITRNAFSRRLRALIGTAARKAYIDGLNDGGVQVETLDESEQLRFVQMLGNQSGYVTDFARTLYDTGLSDAQAAQRPAMWFNKTIEPFYDEGRYSADRNGMYEWVLGVAEHCSTCLRLSGQRHRLKEWYKRNLVPKSSLLECRGYNCACTIVRSNEGAKGRF